jgi:N-acyl-D-amino-acid deacylase
LRVTDRGLLQAGRFADVVVFDPQKIQDHATYEQRISTRPGWCTCGWRAGHQER